MINSHTLKISAVYFEALKRGDKTCEIRKNDRLYEVGDLLLLNECKDGHFTGRALIFDITHIDDFEQKDGFVVLSIKRA